MGRLGGLWAVVLVLLTTPAAAKVSVKLEHITPGTALTLESGEQVRYYNLAEYKLLLKLDKSYSISLQQIDLLGKSLDTWKTIAGSMESVVESKDRQISIHEGRSDRLYKKWGKCEDDLSDERSGFDWSSFGIGVVVGGTVVAVGLSITVIALAFAG